MTSDLGIAEDRWQVGACDLGLAKDRGWVGAGDKRVNITAFSSGDRVGKFLEVTLRPREQGGRGHLGGDSAYLPKPVNVIRISLYYARCFISGRQA